LICSLFYLWILIRRPSLLTTVGNGVRREKETGKLSIFSSLILSTAVCVDAFSSFFFSPHIEEGTKYNIFPLHTKACHKQNFYSFFLFLFQKEIQFISLFISIIFSIFCFHSIRNIWQLYIHRRSQLFSVYVKTFVFDKINIDSF